MRRIAFYVLHNESGVVADYVFYKLKKLCEHVEKAIVICQGQLLSNDRIRLEDIAHLVHVRDSRGSVDGAHREGIMDVVGIDELTIYDELIFLDDTIYAPIFPFSEVFSDMASRDVDFWSITAERHGAQRVGLGVNNDEGADEVTSRLASRFLVVRRSLFSRDIFHKYLQNPTRPPFTNYFVRRGFRSALYCTLGKAAKPRGMTDLTDALIESRCPILKRQDLLKEPLSLEKHGLDLARTLSLLKTKTTYDTDLIWKDLARSAKPRNLYTSATLFEVLNTTGQSENLRSDIKVGVLAHAYYPEMLTEILSYLRNIPVCFDLYLTTASVEKQKALEARIAAIKEPWFRLRGIRVVENRGRDVSALLVGLRDVVLEGSYDYLCRIHSKMSPQDSFGMARHFKAHLYENLLASPAYVGRLLKLFETEQRLGVVMAPVVHIGYPTLGHSWFANRPMAEAWALKLGIDIPFDDFTPLAAYGSMYWFRPEALKHLFAYTFCWKDFPEEPNYSDGGLAHVLERLVVYAAHQDGYYAKCALTPGNAAENYVKLEYKLQSAAHQTYLSVGSNELPNFPKRAIKNYLKYRITSAPKMRLALKELYRVGRTTYQTAKQALYSYRGGTRATYKDIQRYRHLL